MFNVSITPNYRLTSDGSQFILKERRTVDPTKAPNWAKLAAQGADPTPREDWKDVGYYGLNEKGVSSAIMFVIMRTVVASDAENLRDFSRLLRETSESIRGAIEAQIVRSDYAIGGVLK
ncbi:hypothetical protein [Paenibacillus apiarius]|uniref:hypothetical protein n=1 Tax=Paenibacillus apiarius TaxID=46240 RepID=UPI003B3A5DF4